MNLKVLLAAILAVSLAAPAIAGDGEQAQNKDAPKEKKICRTERVTGSLVSQRRICMTKSEWDKLAADTKRDVEDIQRNAGAIPRTAGGNGSTAGFQ
jgi:predicted secreted protein